VPTSLDTLNRRESEAFIALVGPVFEGSPSIASAAAALRPFHSRDHLHATLCALVRESGEAPQLALIRAHPDLVPRVALSAESSREQRAAGLVGLNADDAARFERYNTAYKARFGFPFVICAREHRKDGILDAFERRLSRTRDEEIAEALEQIFRIAALRLADLLP